MLPFTDQDAYDRLLWACDLNVIRGEDSFVRAQWARKPLVWQAYRQEEGSHWPKIEAFLERYCTDLPDMATHALQSLWRSWNADSEETGSAWPAFRSQWPALQARAVSHATTSLRATEKALGKTVTLQLDTVGDLATNLVKFCNEKS